jgi:hypothetical protein
LRQSEFASHLPAILLLDEAKLVILREAKGGNGDYEEEEYVVSESASCFPSSGGNGSSAERQ